MLSVIVGYLLLVVAAFFAELVSLVLVGSYLGWLWTFGLLALSVLVGVVLVSGRGAATVREVVLALRDGRSPGAALVDGVLLAVAGILFITPGFASDAAGLALLLPPVRAGIRARLRDWIVGRWRARFGADVEGGLDGADDGGGIEVIDATGHETRAPRAPRGPSLPS
jgi:UPF0716 protein FxsA